MIKLLMPPAFHKFADVWVLTRRRPPQLAVIHIRKPLDVTHVVQYGNETLIKRSRLYLMSWYRVDKFRCQRAWLALVPIKHVTVCFEVHSFHQSDTGQVGFFVPHVPLIDRKSTRLNSSHANTSY